MVAVVDDLAAAGVISAAQGTAQIDCSGRSAIGVAIAGTFVGTLIPEATIDGVNFFAIDMFGLNGDAPVESITAALTGVIPCAGYQAVRVRCSAYTSGSVSVAFNASAAPNWMPNTRQTLTILASAARTALVTGSNIPVGSAKSLVLAIDITVNAGSSAHLTVTVSGIDPVSGKKYTLLASASLSAVATTTLSIGPGLPATSNVSANAVLPENIVVDVAVGDTSPCTYSIGGILIP